jgi:hypothetical protein
MESDLNSTLEYEESIHEMQTETQPTSDIDLSNMPGTEFEIVRNKTRTKSKRVHPITDSDNDEEQYQNKQKIQKNDDEQTCVILAESREVNLAMANHLQISKSLNDLVGKVLKVNSKSNVLKILCNKKQANILKKETKLGKYQCSFSVQDKKDDMPKVKGIIFGIDTDITDAELKLELKKPMVKVENVYRLKKYDADLKEKVNTKTVIVEFSSDSDIQFPM